MQGLVLVAGFGERMRPLSFSVPKPLITVLGKPIVAYILERLKEVGVLDIGLVVGRQADYFKEKLKDGAPHGVKITYVVQERRLGIAHAIFRGIEENFVKREFVVALGDNYFSDSFKPFVEKFKEGHYDVFIILTRHKNPERFGNAVVKDGKVVRLVEKPPVPPPDSYVLTGLYFFRDPDAVAKAFRELKPSARGEYEITDLIQWFIDRGARVGYAVTDGWWKDMGTPHDLIELVRLVLDKADEKIEGEVSGAVYGRAVVEKGAVVEGVVHGPAYIGRGAYVKRGAELEHYVSLEEMSVVESGSVSRSLLLEESRVSLGQGRLTDSVIGPRSTVKLKAGRYSLVLGEANKVEEI